MIIFVVILAAVALISVSCIARQAGAHQAGSGLKSASPVENPYDIQRLRRELLASAQSDEELGYLKELDALDLCRRHLIC